MNHIIEIIDMEFEAPVKLIVNEDQLRLFEELLELDVVKDSCYVTTYEQGKDILKDIRKEEN